MVAVDDNPGALGEGVPLGDGFEVLRVTLREVARDDDAVGAVCAQLVVVDLDRLVDLAGARAGAGAGCGVRGAGAGAVDWGSVSGEGQRGGEGRAWQSEM